MTIGVWYHDNNGSPHLAVTYAEGSPAGDHGRCQGQYVVPNMGLLGSDQLVNR